MSRIKSTSPADKRELLCLVSLASRICVARRNHGGLHYYVPLARPGELSGADLRAKGFREGSIIETVSRLAIGIVRGSGLRIEVILPTGVVVARTLSSGKVLSMNAEYILQKYALSRK